MNNYDYKLKLGDIKEVYSILDNMNVHDITEDKLEQKVDYMHNKLKWAIQYFEFLELELSDKK